MMDWLPYVDVAVVLVALAGAYYNMMGKLDEVKRETEENRIRSIAAQDVVAKNTEAINKLMVVLARIEVRLEDK